MRRVRCWLAGGHDWLRIYTSNAGYYQRCLWCGKEKR